MRICSMPEGLTVLFIPYNKRNRSQHLQMFTCLCFGGNYKKDNIGERAKGLFVRPEQSRFAWQNPGEAQKVRPYEKPPNDLE